MRIATFSRAAALGAAALAASLPAHSQSAPAAAAPSCPAAHEVTQAHMLGLWRAEFQGLWQGATLLLEKHPEYAGTLRGMANRNGERSLLAGDVVDGEFTLEESRDGKRISAVWLGDVVEGSCGDEIRGSWHEDSRPEARFPFVLRKLPR